jgi:hypothetical protein
MRQIGVLVGFLLLCAGQAGAQANVGNSYLLTSPSVSLLAQPSALLAPAAFTPAAAVPEPAAAAAAAQEARGVFGDYYTQVSVGYSFMPFYEAPGTHPAFDGLTASVAYYMKYWVAADMEAFGAVARQNGQTESFVFVGLGPRVRWVTRTGTELWAHALVGYAHFGPQTLYVTPGGVGGEMGAGVDFGPPHRRWAWRVQGDAVATRLFGTYQLSPKASAGIVLKF